MSLRATPRRRAVPALGLAAAALLAGCGVGQQAMTYNERPTVDGTNTMVGQIAVRDLSVSAPADGRAFPAGSDAPVTVTLVNQGSAPDTLVSASTPAARSVQLVGSERPLSPTDTRPVQYRLLLQGLTRDLPTGTYISMTLTFASNGSQEMLVPVSVTPDGVPRPTASYSAGETDSAGKPITAAG